MRTYETTFIINPQTDDATIDNHIKQVADLITSSKGDIIHQENMGTRRLAYEIKGLSQGFYANFVYKAPQDFLNKLDRHFKLNEAYIRNLTIRYDGDPEDIFKKKDLLSKNKPDFYDSRRNKKPDDSQQAPPDKETAPVEKPVEDADATQEIKIPSIEDTAPSAPIDEHPPTEDKGSDESEL